MHIRYTQWVTENSSVFGEEKNLEYFRAYVFLPMTSRRFFSPYLHFLRYVFGSTCVPFFSHCALFSLPVASFTLNVLRCVREKRKNAFTITLKVSVVADFLWVFILEVWAFQYEMENELKCHRIQPLSSNRCSDLSGYTWMASKKSEFLLYNTRRVFLRPFFPSFVPFQISQTAWKRRKRRRLHIFVRVHYYSTSDGFENGCCCFLLAAYSLILFCISISRYAVGGMKRF